MPSLFTELRRRNVFKVGAAYAIVAWLLIQVADVVLPALQAPEWTIGFVTVQPRHNGVGSAYLEDVTAARGSGAGCPTRTRFGPER